MNSGKATDDDAHAATRRFLVAIDFGTSHSGFAYSHKADSTTVEALYQWDGQPHLYSKTLTALLYDHLNLPVAWGYSAHQQFLRLKPSERPNYTYVTRFKLMLDEKSVQSGFKGPEGFSEVTLIGDYLTFMRKKIQSTLELKFGASFSMSLVHWCLTVPAMWSDRAKHYTRKAAAFAELIDEPTSSSLSIILEPEAAALFVSSTMKGSLKDGNVFMILDAGGGTVDLTVHRVHDSDGNQTFEEMAPGHGKSCGSTFVDDRFLAFFKAKVGAEVYEEAESERREEIAQILKSWEPIKRAFKGVEVFKKTDCEYVPIPNKMHRSMSEEAIAELADLQEGFEDTVQMQGKDMLGFFDPIVEDIIALAHEMRDRCPDQRVDKILCVGGFTESAYLIRRIRDTFTPAGIEVICPADPGAAVVKGAVLFGLNPTAIAVRRARLTYGLAVRGYWDESYPETKRTWDRYQRVYMVEDKFDRLVKIGAEVPVNHVATRIYYPPATWSKSIRLSLYASSSENPRLIDEPGCFQKAEVTIPLDLDTTASINDYPIEISVRFGASEMRITATNQRSSEVYSHDVNYDIQAPEIVAPVAAGTAESLLAASAANGAVGDRAPASVVRAVSEGESNSARRVGTS